MLQSEEEIISGWNGDPSKPLVTIRCLTYNHVKYIRQTIEGFLSQRTTFPFEIIIHDDASTDGTTDIVREYAAAYPGIIVPIIQTENQYSKHDGSIRKAINSKICGKYIAICEGDDYWVDNGKLEKQITYMMNHPGCSMSFHAVNYVDDTGVIKVERVRSGECDVTAEEIVKGGGMFVSTPSICCKTSIFLQQPKFREIADIGDYPLQLLMASNGTVHYFPDVMASYRVMSQGSWSERQKNINNRRKHTENQLEWLAEFDRYSSNQYHKLVEKKIALCYLQLYKMGSKSFKETVRYIGHMSISPRKVLYLVSILKNIKLNRKMREIT